MKTIKLDYDRKTIPLKRIIKILSTLSIPYHVTEDAIKKTKKGWHMEIPLKKDLPDFIIGYLQALMDSDYKRETFNLIRILSKTEYTWNILFNKKYRMKNGKLKLVSKEQVFKDIKPRL